ncbi:hypothetical protein [Aquabacterium sp.]|uniref:hypothetical protein n=1 Tax=Aquabacterium sp. TaxID=1872578 RepID=UPI002D19F5A3|nr:hypothetical protein [Aquabacterium sp.]HSW05019.1 hypothetical protein [Aquabacterium sp.]
MADLWPWLAVAGLGALHGLSPATGWMFAAAWGVQAGGGAQVRRALLPIAAGHAASIVLVALAFAQGQALDRALVQGLAGALLVAAALLRLLRGAGPCARASRPPRRMTGHAGLLLWSFLMATAHGAGLMLVPALVPLCLADNPAREITASGSLVLAGAAVGLHTAAMLITIGVIATGVCRGVALHPRLLSGTASRQAWTAALAVTGGLLMVFR